MKKLFLIILLLGLCLALGYRAINKETNTASPTARLMPETATQTTTVTPLVQTKSTAPAVLPKGARLVTNPLADFVLEQGYHPDSVSKFIQFTGKQPLLLSELPERQRQYAIDDLAKIESQGYANISDQHTRAFHQSLSLITHAEAPENSLGFTPQNIDTQLQDLDYEYQGVISPHANLQSDSNWNSLTQVYRKGDQLLTLDQSHLGHQGTAFITQGYDNVYINQEYPASYLTKKSESGEQYFSLYFATAHQVYEIKTSSDIKPDVIALAEALVNQTSH